MAAQIVSTTDPDAYWAGKGGPTEPSYLDNYLVDNASGVILGVEATRARRGQEALAGRRLLQQA